MSTASEKAQDAVTKLEYAERKAVAGLNSIRAKLEVAKLHPALQTPSTPGSLAAAGAGVVAHTPVAPAATPAAAVATPVPDPDGDPASDEDTADAEAASLLAGAGQPPTPSGDPFLTGGLPASPPEPSGDPFAAQ